MKLKKIKEYNSKKQIWRLLIADANKLLVEERDTDKKEVFFSLIEIGNGKVLWNNFQAEEKFWIGVETLYKEVIVMHKFGKPDMPMHKEILVYSLNNNQLIWKTDRYEYLFTYEDKIFCMQKGFSNNHYYALDYLTGDIIEDLENDVVKINELRLKCNSGESFAGYLYSNDFLTQSDLSEDEKNLITDFVAGYEISGKTEYLKYSSYIMFNFYSKNKNGLLSNRFCIFDTIKKKAIVNQVLIESAKAYVPDSFFMKDNYLFVLKEKNTVIIYSFGE